MLNTSNPNREDATAPARCAEDGVIYVVLNNQKEGLFICPACRKGVTKNLGRIANAQSAIHLKCTCKCGHVFRVLVERRCNVRRLVNLVGMCIYIDRNGETKKRLIKIHDVSTAGLQFSVNVLPDFKLGDQLVVEFRLDDRERTSILEKGTVMRVQSKNVGFKFNSAERISNFKLHLSE